MLPRSREGDCFFFLLARIYNRYTSIACILRACGTVPTSCTRFLREFIFSAGATMYLYMYLYVLVERAMGIVNLLSAFLLVSVKWYFCSGRFFEEE